MYCPNCGTKVADNARFCPNCGTSLAGIASSVSAMSSPEPVNDLSQSVPTAAASLQEPVSYAAPVQQPSSYAAPVQQPVSYAATMQQGTQPIQPGQNPPPASLVQNAGTAFGYEPRKTAETPDYSYPQETVPGYDTGIDPYAYAPAEPQKKKGRIWLVIVAVLLILAILAGFFASLLGGRSDKRFDQYVQEAQTAYAEEDYAKAIEMYEKALELKPNDEQIREELGQLYNSRFFGLVTTGDYANAVAALENAVRFGSITEEDSAELYEATYGLWITELLAAEDYEACAAVLEEAKPYIKEEDYNTFLSWMNEGMASQGDPDSAVTDPAGPADAAVPGIESLALWIASSVDKNSHLALCIDLHDEDDIVNEALAGRPQLTVPVTGCGYGYVVFYADDGFSGRYYVYYGDLNSSGERDGEGWILSRPDNNGPNVYLFRATWENGKANGPFGEFVARGEDFDEITVYTGNLKDGHYDGEIQILWRNGVTYTALYVDGYPTVFDTTEDGADVIAYSDDYSSWLTIPHGTSEDERVGVEPM